MTLSELGFFVAMIMAFASFRYWIRSRHERPEDFRRRFETAFRALRIDAEDAIHRFDGARAIVVDDTEFRFSQHDNTIISIERYARNEAGEYFFFLFEGKVPFFFKHIAHGAAKVVLKEKYTPPPQ